MFRIMMSFIVLYLLLLVFVLKISTKSININDEVDRLRREYPENELLLEKLQNYSYEIINPIQMRQHLKLGISTKYTSLDTSDKHYQQTTLLIKAFNYDLRLELELNIYLLSPNLFHKTFLPDGVIQLSHQPLENCYYHATIKDYPDAIAALRTCDGISGIIYLPNDTLVIRPFYGGDLSIRHPHIIYHLDPEGEMIRLACDEDEVEEIKFNETGSDDNLTDSVRSRRDIQELVKYVEIALVLDKAMFSTKNGIRSAVVGDIIQSVNYVDLYYKHMNTRLSIVYLETWNEKDQIELEGPIDGLITEFINYAAEKLASVSRDVVSFIAGREMIEDKLGTCIPESICTDQSVVFLQGTTDTHVIADTMAHLLGHTIGLKHDSVSCSCDDWWRGCIMDEEITSNCRSKFSSCSLEKFLNILQNNDAICLFNKPYPLENIPFCGNGIIETDEDCDCGSIQDCLANEPCCDPITCKLKRGAECNIGDCCENCKLKPKGYLCRGSVSECDIPEYCNGINGECPMDIYRKNGNLCGDDDNYCYLGTCPVPRSLCEHIWGYNSYIADQVCFDRLNVQGGLGGHCGRDGQGGYFKCQLENVRCGALQCRGGLYNTPLMEVDTEFTSAIFTDNGTKHECKLMQGNETTDIWTITPEGSKCGENKVCVNRSCITIDIIEDRCPSNNDSVPCSGHGICSTIDTCYCDKGWKSFDCSKPDNSTISEDSNTRYPELNEWKPLQSIVTYTESSPVINLQLMLIIAVALVISITPFTILAIYSNCTCCQKQSSNTPGEQNKVEIDHGTRSSPNNC